MSLVAMGVEILLELCNTIMVEKRKWVLYGSVTAGTPMQILPDNHNNWHERSALQSVAVQANDWQRR